MLFLSSNWLIFSSFRLGLSADQERNLNSELSIVKLCPSALHFRPCSTGRNWWPPRASNHQCRRATLERSTLNHPTQLQAEEGLDQELLTLYLQMTQGKSGGKCKRVNLWQMAKEPPNQNKKSKKVKRENTLTKKRAICFGTSPCVVKPSYDFGDTNTSASEKEDSTKWAKGPRRAKLTVLFLKSKWEPKWTKPRALMSATLLLRFTTQRVSETFRRLAEHDEPGKLLRGLSMSQTHPAQELIYHQNHTQVPSMKLIYVTETRHLQPTSPILLRT